MKIRIMGIPFEIKEVDVIEGGEGGVSLGQITYSDCIIKLRRSLPADLKRITLLHEIIHGIFVTIGRNDLCDDETLVQSLAMAIDQTFDLEAIFEEETI